MGKLAAAAVAAVALIGIGACSNEKTSSAGGGNRGGTGSAFSATVQRAGGSSAEVDPATSAAGDGDGRAVVDTATPVGAPIPDGLGAAKVVKTASIDLEVAKGAFDAAFSKVPTIAAANGGFVASSQSSQAGRADDDDGAGQAAGSLIVRVPAQNFDAARQALIGLGELRAQQLRGEDVGGQLTDLEARLRNLRSQEEAIRLLMTKATTIGETIEVQRQLGTVREQIEQLAGEQARIADAVDLSTLTLSMSEPGAVTKSEMDPSPLARALRNAVNGAQSVLAAVIVGLGYLLPLGILLGLGWLIARPLLGQRAVTST